MDLRGEQGSACSATFAEGSSTATARKTLQQIVSNPCPLFQLAVLQQNIPIAHAIHVCRCWAICIPCGPNA